MLSALRLSEVGGRTHALTTLRVSGRPGVTSSFSWCYPWCYWGVGAPSPTLEWGMLGDWKHLNFLFY